MRTKTYQIILTLLFFATAAFAQIVTPTRGENFQSMRPLADGGLVIEQAYLVPIDYEDIY